MQNGQLLLDRFAEVRFSPLSNDQFRAVDGTAPSIQIRFERREKTAPLLLHLEMPDQKPTTYEAIQVASPTPALLQEYVGEFHSDELRATYKFVVEEGKLFFSGTKTLPKSPLEPTLRDQFRMGDLTIEFSRDHQNRLFALTLYAGRVKNIRFTRKAP